MGLQPPRISPRHSDPPPVRDSGAARVEPAREPDPPESSPLRALVLVLLIDAGIGLWLQLHNPSALPLYVVLNAPTVGVMGFFWPLLPKEVKDPIGAGIARLLLSRRGGFALLVVGGTLLLASLFFSSVTVALLDPSTSAALRVVRGSQLAPDSQAVRTAVSLRLNRLTTPESAVFSIRPTGQRVWLYSPTHVLAQEARLLPWIPLRLQYPDDFVPMARIVVLPGSSMLMRAKQQELLLTVREGVAGPVLARLRLDSAGTIIAFLAPAPFAPADTARWETLLNPQRDTTERVRQFTAGMLGRVLRARWVPSARPLHLGETVAWDVQSAMDSTRTVGRGTLSLDAPVADLYLKF